MGMLNDLSTFLQETIAEFDGDTWIVYCDPIKRALKIYNCEGNNEFEAKEDAYCYLQLLQQELAK